MDPIDFRPGRGPIVMVSDAHLGAPTGPPERAAWLAEYLESLPGRIGGLLVLGDLFDFWFEYRHAIPKGHFRICRALAEITRSGAPALYFGGNHDFWAGSYLRDELGMQVANGPLRLDIEGRRIFFAHGDGLARGDLGYRLLKRMLRNRIMIALYRSIHPDLGIPIGYRVSSLSRRHTEPREVLVPRLYREIARPRLREGHDAVVIGHIHEPTHVKGEEGEFLMLGDWIENFTYATLENGQFALFRYRSGKEPERLPVETSPGGGD